MTDFMIDSIEGSARSRAVQQTLSESKEGDNNGKVTKASSVLAGRELQPLSDSEESEQYSPQQKEKRQEAKLKRNKQFLKDNCNLIKQAFVEGSANVEEALKIKNINYRNQNIPLVILKFNLSQLESFIEGICIGR